MNSTDESSAPAWNELYWRKKPILSSEQATVFSWKLIGIVILGIIPIPGVMTVIGSFRDPDAPPSLCGIGFFLLVYAFIFSLGKDFIQGTKQGLSSGEKFRQGKARAVAKILRRHSESHLTQYGDVSRNDLQLEFMTSNDRVVRLNVSVTEHLYKRLINSTSINVTYALNDPWILLIDGE